MSTKHAHTTDRMSEKKLNVALDTLIMNIIFHQKATDTLQISRIFFSLIFIKFACFSTNFKTAGYELLR